MRYNINLNQPRCMEHNLDISEAAMMDLLNQLSSWADQVIIGGKQYYHISRHKVIEELPFFFKQPDTVYRVFRRLQQKKLIVYKKRDGKDYIRLSRTGQRWNKHTDENQLGSRSESGGNSDHDPSKFGFRSEFNNAQQNSSSVPENTRVSEDQPKPDSDFDPTDNIITIQEITPHAHIRAREGDNAFSFLKKHIPVQLEAWMMQQKKQIGNFELFLVNYNCTVDIEGLPYKSKILFRRLEKYTANWIENRKQGKTPRQYVQQEEPLPPYLKHKFK
ncbi:MAG: hypothetical protein AAF934_00335 [Bacteroidota bacterium]